MPGEAENWRIHKEPVRDAGHALHLLDDVDSLVRFCSTHMPDVERYYRGSEAMWRVARWIASLPIHEESGAAARPPADVSSASASE